MSYVLASLTKNNIESNYFKTNSGSLADILVYLEIEDLIKHFSMNFFVD